MFLDRPMSNLTSTYNAWFCAMLDEQRKIKLLLCLAVVYAFPFIKKIKEACF
jgi:hypothetical protein